MTGSLGEFLVSRRASLEPAAVGLPGTGVRRVRGLRREEVAVRAGVSADYYTRLEQGRELHPSPQVLDALTRALLLDEDAREHLYRLAGAIPALGGSATERAVTPELRQLLTDVGTVPALVLSRTLDVLARNDLCRTLHEGFALDGNSARMAFLDPHGCAFYVGWPDSVESAVAGLRHAAGVTPDDSSLVALVRELSDGSEEFAAMWGRQRVRAKTNEDKAFRHPRAGEVRFRYQSFDVRGAPGQQLVFYGRVEGDDSVDRLRELTAP